MLALATPQTPIRPSDINARRRFWNAFGSLETETSAAWIVSFCQQRNVDSWKPFALVDLQKFYAEGRQREETFLFNALLGSGFVRVVDGMVEVSLRFVTKCYDASPLTN